MALPEEICKEISIALPKYELLPWINREKLYWREISKKSEAMDLIKSHPAKVNWKSFCQNPHPEALEMIGKNPERIHWGYLLCNTNPDITLIANRILSRRTCRRLFGRNFPWNRKLFRGKALWTAEKVREHVEKLKDEEDESFYIFSNPDITELALRFVKNNSDIIDTGYIFKNPSPVAVKMIKEIYNETEISWWHCMLLSRNKNPEIIQILKENPENIDWSMLSSNSCPEALEILKNNKDKIDWSELSANKNPEALEILKNNKDKIEWISLCQNQNSEALEILKNNKDKIEWKFLCDNENPEAIELLRNNIVKIHWKFLCENKNPDAIELLRIRPEAIDYYRLSSNPAIFSPVADKELFKVLNNL